MNISPFLYNLIYYLAAFSVPTIVTLAGIVKKNKKVVVSGILLFLIVILALPVMIRFIAGGFDF